MKIAVRYQSRGGNTKAVAEAIASATGVKAEPASVPIDGPVDILFVGGGVYKWDIDDSLKNCLKKLAPATVRSIAAFSTAGGMDGAKKIAAIAKEKGIHVHDETLPIKVGLRNHAALGREGTIELTDKQIRSVNSFARNVTQNESRE